MATQDHLKLGSFDFQNSGNGIPLQADSGRILSVEEREALAKKKGICMSCGITTHKGFIMKAPLTNKGVYQGICIKCRPRKIPGHVLKAKNRSSRQLDFSAKEETITCSPTATPNPVNKKSKSQFPFGGSPFGSMKIEICDDQVCPGFQPPCSVISLLFNISSSIQSHDHENPGVSFAGKKIRTFLPNNPEGCELLTRIKFAFEHGYMLKIGKSASTGKENQTTFTDIPNKTSLNGSPFGFPDEQYTQKAHRKLSDVKIPDAQACLAYYEPKKQTSLSPAPRQHRLSVGSSENKTVTCTAPQRRDDIPTSKFPFGGGPSGSVNIEFWNAKDCPGFQPPCSVISMEFDIPSSAQLEYHPYPGVTYEGKRIRTLLPNNPEGRKLLTRIKFAFEHGYMFKIGRSLSTGKENQTIFTEIPNKTSLQGGPFGFPDDNYIAKANEALDKIKIPSVNDCLVHYSQRPDIKNPGVYLPPTMLHQPQLSSPNPP